MTFYIKYLYINRRQGNERQSPPDMKKIKNQNHLKNRLWKRAQWTEAPVLCRSVRAHRKRKRALRTSPPRPPAPRHVPRVAAKLRDIPVEINAPPAWRKFKNYGKKFLPCSGISQVGDNRAKIFIIHPRSPIFSKSIYDYRPKGLGMEYADFI